MGKDNAGTNVRGVTFGGRMSNRSLFFLPSWPEMVSTFRCERRSWMDSNVGRFSRCLLWHSATSCRINSCEHVSLSGLRASACRPATRGGLGFRVSAAFASTANQKNGQNPKPYSPQRANLTPNSSKMSKRNFKHS